jgi:hypothetical protein
LGQRSRKRRAAGGARRAPARPAGSGRTPAPGDAAARTGSRSEQRAAEIRASLEPLRPGERPRVVTVATVIAVAFAIANLAAAFAGEGLYGEDASPATAIIPTLILLVAAAGMWRAKYWAVLGFQALLALQIVSLSLALLRVERWWVGLIVLAILGALGYLFWKLVRALARLQMPPRP